MLPELFKDRMKDMLGDEYESFEKSYDREKYQALRVNTLKADVSDFSDNSPFHLTKVPWAENGFYYSSEDTPGKHPYHEAGVYYIQEPSAMAPAKLLGATPGERILDTCAAPGGKTTQIASYMKGQGILICNEIVPGRAKILSENVERMGIRNAIVTNESTDHLAELFKNFFDRIMVDAPCSGEGMFRKNENACEEWSPENVKLCADRQDMILNNADIMLKAGGRIVYSTCTFAPEEDERTVERFICSHPEYVIEDAVLEGIDGHGIPEWCSKPVNNIEKTLRLWPHKLKGEGHFVAVLRKGDSLTAGEKASPKYGYIQGINPKDCRECIDFIRENIQMELTGSLIRFGDQIYLAPEDTPSLKGLKVLRPGLHLGTMKKNRFEPSHSLALALESKNVLHCAELSADDSRTQNYLRGQTFEYEGDKGWYLICVDGYSLGWGKLAGGIMKNHYPKGLRKM